MCFPCCRPGRLDRKIEIPLPNDAARLEILKIHAGPVSKKGEFGTSPCDNSRSPINTESCWRRASYHTGVYIATLLSFFFCDFVVVGGALCLLVHADWEAVVKLTEGFNGADMRNVCTEVRATRQTATMHAQCNADGESFCSFCIVSSLSFVC